MASLPREMIRAAGDRLAAAVLRQASRPYVLAPGGALVIAPHPDDETLGCGGLLAAKVRAGHEVRVVFVTDGSGSHPRHPALDPGELARRRRTEAVLALDILGVRPGQTRFLEIKDGSLAHLDAAAAAALTRKITDLIREFKPAEVFVTWRDDGSSEHAAACQLTVGALAAAGGGRLLEYPVWAWWNPLRLRRRFGMPDSNLRLRLGPLLPDKLRALASHRTQTEATPPWLAPVLPEAIRRACCGPDEFFFSSHVSG